MLDKLKNRLGLVLQVARHGRLSASEERQIPQISAEDVAEIKTFFPMDKFFIFGYARSGTTLLARLVRRHPEVHCNYQAHFFSRPPLLSGMASEQRFGEWLSRLSNRWNRGQDMSAAVLRAMADYILERDARKEGARIVGDKSPNVLLNGRAVTEMHTFYPEARLIYIVRDGRDTLISHRFQQFIDGKQHLSSEDLRIQTEFERDPSPFINGQRSIFTEKAIRRMTNSWVTNIAETHTAGQEHYGDRYHVLRYEDLLRAPYATISNVWRFLGADHAGLESEITDEMNYNPDAAYQQEVAADLVQPLEKGKRGSWRELFTDRDKQIFKQIAGQTLIDWGYEQDMEW